MADVTSQHADYGKNLALWQMVEDAAAGEQAVKVRKEKYLPRPNANDKSKAAQDRYDAYLQRALRYGFRAV